MTTPWKQAVLWLREHPDKQDLIRDSYFDDPLLVSALRYSNGSEWSAIQAILPLKTGVALDVGAGRGISSFALTRLGWKVTALEPDPGCFVGAGAIRNLVQQAGVSIQIVEGFCENIPFADASFDLVFARQVLHHFLSRVYSKRVDTPGRVFSFLAYRKNQLAHKEYHRGT